MKALGVVTTSLKAVFCLKANKADIIIHYVFYFFSRISLPRFLSRHHVRNFITKIGTLLFCSGI